jgi:hypothetical protein
MKKSIGIAVAVFLLLSVGQFGLYRMSHIPIFPGTQYQEEIVTPTAADTAAGAPIQYETVEEEGMVSLLDHFTPAGQYSFWGRLNGMGYALAVFLILILPAIIAGGVFWKLNGKEKK